MHDSSDTTAWLLFDFADQLVADLEQGRALPLAHYQARFPGHDERIAREYDVLTGKTPAASRATLLTDVRVDTRGHLGPYRLGEVLGRGGQGIVYRAVDARLDRTVALKVLSLAVASVSQSRRNRFRREAEIVARLDHPGICTVLDADLAGETPYIAMRFIEGETLADAISRTRTARDARRDQPTPTPTDESATSASRLLAPRRALELGEALSFFERAARALHAAHEAGVIHRDIKPGNIMVSKDGAPVILDFGLARDEDEESSLLTRSGEVFGTPAYISPEQLSSGRDVDRRTDVYSLGVVLYECLTLVRPFQGESSAALARAIQNDPPPPVRRHNPVLSADLAIVLETALEKDVVRRYPTALELAEELRRVRSYEPIHARPAGPLLRLRRFAQRNPVVATGTIGSIAALSLALIVALVLLGRVRHEKSRKEAALDLYEGAWYRDQATSSLQYSPPRSVHFAIAAAERDPGLASNGALLAALDSLYLMQLLVGHSDIVMHVDVDASSNRVLTSSSDGSARMWDAHSGVELARFSMGTQTVLCSRFSPDGARIVTAGSSGALHVWRTASPATPPVSLVGHTGDVQYAEFSPDGSRVVGASRDHGVTIFDASTGRALIRLAGHTGSVGEARFLDGAKFVLTRSSEPTVGATAQESDFTARLFDAASGAELRVFRGHTAGIVCLAVSPDLSWFVTTSEDHTARLWPLDLAHASVDRATQIAAADQAAVVGATEVAAVRVFDAPGKFHGASFHPDGRLLALAWDASAKVVDLVTGATQYVLPSHAHRAVARIAFSPDGALLATVAYDDAVRIFRATDGELLRLCRGDARQISGLVWSPDSSFVASWQRKSTVDLWFGAERPFLQVLRGHAGEVKTARFDRDAHRILTASADGTARLWNAKSAACERVFDPHAIGRERRPLIGAAFDGSGEKMATTDEAGCILVWNVRDASIAAEFKAGRNATKPAIFSPDGSRIIAGGDAGTAVLHDLAAKRTRVLGTHTGDVACFAFSGDGARVATGAEDRTVCLWDAALGVESTAVVEPLWRSAPFASDLFHLQSVFDVEFSSDGRFVAAAYENQSIELLDVRDGRARAEGKTSTQGGIEFSGDGSRLIGTSKYSGFVTLWRIDEDAAGLRLEREFLPAGPGLQHTNSLTSCAAAAHAPRMVTGSFDRCVRLWDLARRECLASYAGHTDRVLDVDISGDGELIVSASSDGTARVWPGDLYATAKRFEPSAFAASFGPLPVPQPRK